MTPVEDEQPEPEGGSRTAGGCVLFVLGGGCVTVTVAAAPTTGTLLFWGASAGWLWWAVDDSRRCVHDAPDPAPPPLPEEGEGKKPQFTVVDDPDNPHHSVVVWNTEKGPEP